MTRIPTRLKRLRALAMPTFVATLMLVTGGCRDDSDVRVEDLERAIFPTFEELEANMVLVEDAVVVCMKASGFDYEPIRWQFSSEDTLDFPRMHTWTRDLASRIGFGFTVEGTIQDFDPPIAGMSPEQIADFADAHMHCKDHAEEEVNGDYHKVVRAARDDHYELRVRFAAEPEVIELDHRWATCMAGEGHDVPSSFRLLAQEYLDKHNELVMATGPDGGMSPSDFESRRAELFEEERTMALAAVECAEPVAVRYDELWSDYMQQLVDKYGEVPKIPR